MNYTKEEIKQFLKDSIEWLVAQDQGCSTLKLDDRLAICVGWLDGYDENDEDLIHAKDGKSWCLNAGLKVYTSDDMRTDYEFINSPYHDNGEVVQTDVSLKPDGDLDELADYFIKEYANLEDLEIEEDGRIIEDNFDDAYEPMKDDDSEKLPNEAEEIKAKEDEVKEESLKEEVLNKGEQIAQIIAGAFEGRCGPFGNEDPYLDGNKVTFHSQGPSESWIFNDDGSVDSDDDVEDFVTTRDPDDYGCEDEDELRDYFEEIKHFNSVEDLFNSGLSWFIEVPNEKEVLRKINKILNESLNNKQVKESWEGENIIDDLVDRANGMLKDGYGDVDDCVRQAIDDGLIYTSDIRELADHYNTLPDDSELISGFYDELYDDIVSRVEEPEDEEEEEDEEDSFEDEE